MTESPGHCPLCADNSLTHYSQDSYRDYWQCGQCKLVFVAAAQHVNESDEKLRYDLHQNSIHDEGYCTFLGQLLEPLSERLADASEGLDFGCGPGPTLSLLLERKGFKVNCYDKYYLPDKKLLTKQYDFITSTEVLEHLREPRVTIDRLINCLKPGAYLGVMTQLLPAPDQFSEWHYKKDQTHICFYSDDTFKWIAKHWRLKLEILSRDVIILQRWELNV
ncbi:class I SAM-dependent methyltransferase [Leucothrix pacifica]|uniref:Methyltransferase n=1 Tax=Leucothrix pacifica TaxID=1247513 RepID=A0A317CLN2_9GAMM|nr:class I SAM-dependent methyltransferase [Leucothrix pacifica]PWQ97212.1 hypothetical protein DKW60_10805 [Leucothrix pacifica]